MPDIEEAIQSHEHNYHHDLDLDTQNLGEERENKKRQEERENAKRKEERENKLELYKATLSNDWKKAESIFKKPNMEYGVLITTRGETALHVAALAGHKEFVKNMVSKMKKEDISIGAISSRESGNTAFHCAAISGNVKIAEAINKKGQLYDLAIARGNGDNFPIDLAAVKGNKKMVRYLYQLTKKDLEDQESKCFDNEDRKILLIELIKSGIYDIALEVAKALLTQSEVPENMEIEALIILAKNPISSPGFFGIINPFSHRQAKKQKLMYRKAMELIQRLWDKTISDEKKVLALIRSSWDQNPILEAAKQGNFEFLSILIASYPDVLFSIDVNNYTIFHHAILNRHVDIFKLINIGSVKPMVTLFRDLEGNNMLHLAAILAPINRLNIVPGAALQLQRELLWFEEVKKVVEPHEVNRKVTCSSDSHLEKMLKLFEDMETEINKNCSKINKNCSNLVFKKMKNLMDRHQQDHASNSELQRVFQLFEKMKNLMDEHQQRPASNTELETVFELLKKMEKVIKQHRIEEKNKIEGYYTPHDVFVKQHKELMVEGEKWMRDTANSCMIVAVLITTIAFAAAITVPGGNGNDGFPNFSSETLFSAFAIADSVSMISSAIALLDFLSLLTARYTIDDFRWTLPNKLAIGLSTLSVSIVAMMVAYVLSIFIIFKNSRVLLATVVAGVSCVPIVLFICQHLCLFVDVFRSTYFSYLLFNSKKYTSLFKEKKKFL